MGSTMGMESAMDMGSTMSMESAMGMGCTMASAKFFYAKGGSDPMRANMSQT